jgi:membrane peptidoglycan carboxypeptidase
VQPTLLKSQARPEAPRRILPQKVADQVIEALRSVTEDRGTGMSARLEGYTVAGKTGTAQAVDPVTRRYSRSRYIASFIGFAVGVDPKLVIFTSIDEPHGSYYASETAAPLFRAVLNAAATRFSLPARGEASRALAMATQPAKGAAKARKVDGLSDRLSISLAKVIPSAAMTDAEPEPQAPNWVGTTPAGDKLWTMPQLRGLTAREAIRLLAGRRFRLEVHGTGVIRAQSLEPGRPAAEGATLRLTLAEP